MSRIIGEKNTTKESMERYAYTYIYFNMTKEHVGITENKSKQAVVHLNSSNIIPVYN
jgi:rRNA processing protein Krr1/Pno1